MVRFKQIIPTLSILLVLMFLISPASALKLDSQPKGSYSIAYDTTKEFQWRFSKGTVQSQELNMYSISAASHDECSTNVDFKSITPEVKTPDKATQGDYTTIIFSVQDISSQLTLKDTNGEFTSDAAFNSAGKNPYLCQVWQLHVKSDTGDTITSDPIAVKIYQSSDHIPKSERMIGNHSYKWWVYLLLGLFVVPAFYLIQPDN